MDFSYALDSAVASLDLWDKSDDLDAISMVIRAFMVFVATLTFLRIAGRRSFGQGGAFDLCLMVLLGAVLSRAVVGASAMTPTLCAGVTIVILHRLLAMILMRWPALDNLISGHKRQLVREGKLNREEMRSGLISYTDLQIALRKKGGGIGLDEVDGAVLERNGKISIRTKLEGRSK